MTSYARAKAWFFGLGSPGLFHQNTDLITRILLYVAPTVVTVGTVWGAFFAPADARQQEVYRLIYVHVPAAIVAESLYIVMALAAGTYIIWQIHIAGIMVRVTAGVGMVMTLMTLLTGALWGIPTWGTPWLWSDPRLLSSLMLFLLFAGVVALSDSFEDESLGEKFGSILALVGIANLPIIKWSVEWWSSIHQPASIKFSEMNVTLDWLILAPLLIAIIGWSLMTALGVLLRMRSEIYARYGLRVRSSGSS